MTGSRVTPSAYPLRACPRFPGPGKPEAGMLTRRAPNAPPPATHPKLRSLPSCGDAADRGIRGPHFSSLLRLSSGHSEAVRFFLLAANTSEWYHSCRSAWPRRPGRATLCSVAFGGFPFSLSGDGTDRGIRRLSPISFQPCRSPRRDAGCGRGWPVSTWRRLGVHRGCPLFLLDGPLLIPGTRRLWSGEPSRPGTNSGPCGAPC